VQEAANGRFNGNLSDPGATALSLPPDRGRSLQPPRRSHALTPFWLKPTRCLRPEASGADPPHGGDRPRIDSPHPVELA
jgi:hypothetical protein